MQELTERQNKVLGFLRDCLERSGRPPTTLEIQRHFGFASDKAARDHLSALARKDYIELIPGTARGIRLLPAADAMPFQTQLPLVGRVAAGSPILASENIDAWYRVDPDLFRPKASFLFRVQGDSMQDAGILDGDLVGVRRQAVAENGQIVVARLPHPASGEEEITLKRYFRRRNQVTLQPENRAAGYAPFEFDLSRGDESQEKPAVAIEGIYVGLIRVGGRG